MDDGRRPGHRDRPLALPRRGCNAVYRAGTRPWMLWEKEPDMTPLEGLVTRERTR